MTSIQFSFFTILGKFHSGFLDRAKGFPVDKIFNDENYKGKPLIICGHSMGGAVATIGKSNF